MGLILFVCDSIQTGSATNEIQTDIGRMRFSKFFNLNREQAELDFVDVDPLRDLPLYIDPYALSKRKDEWALKGTSEVVSFFQAAIDFIRNKNEARAKQILNNLSEPNETYLGVSSGRPKGRGVSGKQSLDLYKALAESEAVRTGFLSELADCELMIEGIGSDKISDITTNILRRNLIEYTQAQCRLHGISLKGEVASGRLWDAERKEWTQEFAPLPIVHGKKVLLVPKAIVKWDLSLSHQEYYQHFVLNFLQQEHLDSNSSLVHLLRSGRAVVYKKDLKKENPLTKNFLFEFSKRHPEVLSEYKKQKELPEGLQVQELQEGFDEEAFAEILVQRLKKIGPGSDEATTFHHFMIGTLEFIFYPNLIYPRLEEEINEGRKRIDIVFTNAVIGGFFYRAHTDQQFQSRFVMIECKNYSADPGNPEIDQLSGRFSHARGRLGLLVVRTMKDRRRFIKSCRDTFHDGRGVILPLSDKDIICLLELIESERRVEIDRYLDGIFREVAM